MGTPTYTYIDPTAGSDHEGSSFTDGSFANATLTLTKVGAFASAVANDKLYLSDNGSGEVTTAMYKISSVTDNDNVVLTADIRSGANDPTDVVLNQGTGAIGAPYATIQHALNNTTRDSTNGDQFNVKSGTDDVLSGALTLATYGTPTQAAPLIIRGYASAANDGDVSAATTTLSSGTGIGGIDGNGASSLLTGTWSRCHFIHMHLHNTGANIILPLTTFGSVQECEVSNGSAGGLAGVSSSFIGNHLHDISGTGINCQTNSFALWNYFKNGTKDFTLCIDTPNGSNTVARNIMSLDGASNGISLGADEILVHGNSILASSGSGTGINLAANREAVLQVSNIVEGFSSSGVGFNGGSRSEGWHLYGRNASYNNATHYANDADVIFDVGDNETLGASPFAKSGADTYANRHTYFSPVDTGNVHGGAYVGEK
jgi:hypothetical protein